VRKKNRQHHEPKRQATVLSAFTGAGGLDLGLHAAGFDTIGCIECDNVTRSTIEANTSWPLVSPNNIEDVAVRLEPADLDLVPGQLGILAGAPPCQPFSKAAQWARSGMSGLQDPRGATLHSFLTLAEKFLPKVILIENVPGFVRGTNSVLPAIEGRLTTIYQRTGVRYVLQVQKINAAHYGVPQHRERGIVIALREDAGFVWPEPTHLIAPVRAYDALRGLKPNIVPEASGKWAHLLPSIPEGWNYMYHTDRGRGRPLFGERTRFWSFLLKLAKAQPAWTLSANPGPATGPFHWGNRPLAIEEMLRLQTFPVSWKICGDRREQVRQIGNATPPLLAEVLGRALGEHIFGWRYSSPLKFGIERLRRVAPPRKPGSVPREYRFLEGIHPPHPGPGKGPHPRAGGGD
jgi:DNA (cytosine-5)-methyltransferase 1